MALNTPVEALAAVVFVVLGLFSLLVALRQALKETRSGRASGCGGRRLRTADESLPNTWYDEIAPLVVSPCRLPIVVSGAFQVVFNLVGTLAMFLVFRTLALDDPWWQLMILAWLASNILQAAATVLFYDFYAVTAAAIVAVLGWAAVVLAAVAALVLQRYVVLGLALANVAWTTFHVVTVDVWMAVRRCRLSRAHAGLAAAAGVGVNDDPSTIPVEAIQTAAYDFLTRR